MRTWRIGTPFLGLGFLTAQAQMQFWFKIVMFFGVFVLLGALVNAWFLATGREVPPVGEPMAPG